MSSDVNSNMVVRQCACAGQYCWDRYKFSLYAASQSPCLELQFTVACLNHYLFMRFNSHVLQMCLSPSPRRLRFHLCLCLLVFCQQDYIKTTSGVSIKVGWRVGLSPEFTQLTHWVWIRIKRRIQDLFPVFLNMVRYCVFLFFYSDIIYICIYVMQIPNLVV